MPIVTGDQARVVGGVDDLDPLGAGVLRPVLYVGPNGFVRQPGFVQYRVYGSHEDPLHPLRPTLYSRARSGHRAAGAGVVRTPDRESAR